MLREWTFYIIGHENILTFVEWGKEINNVPNIVLRINVYLTYSFANLTVKLIKDPYSRFNPLAPELFFF